MLTLHFENEEQYTFPFDPVKVAKDVIQAGMEEIDCPYACEADLSLVGEEEIRRINLEYREMDKVTDVLSFPMNDYESPGVFDEEALIAQEAFHPDTGELILGDIMLCVPRMRMQAEEYGHGQLREYAFLIAHSFLHLCGFDHMTEEEATQMEECQERILERLSIFR